MSNLNREDSPCKTVSFNWNDAKQFSNIHLLLAVFIPSLFAFIIFHHILPLWVQKGLAAIIAYCRKCIGMENLHGLLMAFYSSYIIHFKSGCFRFCWFRHA
jgi:hypothetical protein